MSGAGYRHWETMAARLVDAQAPGAANTVRGLASVAGDPTGERLLGRAGAAAPARARPPRIDELPDGAGGQRPHPSGRPGGRPRRCWPGRGCATAGRWWALRDTAEDRLLDPACLAARGRHRPPGAGALVRRSRAGPGGRSRRRQPSTPTCVSTPVRRRCARSSQTGTAPADLESRSARYGRRGPGGHAAGGRRRPVAGRVAESCPAWSCPAGPTGSWTGRRRMAAAYGARPAVVAAGGVGRPSGDPGRGVGPSGLAVLAGWTGDGVVMAPDVETEREPGAAALPAELVSAALVGVGRRPWTWFAGRRRPAVGVAALGRGRLVAGRAAVALTYREVGAVPGPAAPEEAADGESRRSCRPPRHRLDRLLAGRRPGRPEIACGWWSTGCARRPRPASGCPRGRCPPCSTWAAGTWRCDRPWRWSPAGAPGRGCPSAAPDVGLPGRRARRRARAGRPGNRYARAAAGPPGGGPSPTRTPPRTCSPRPAPARHPPSARPCS